MPIDDRGHSSLPASALILALGSAVLHAAWNLLLARARDVQAATAATFLLSIAIAAPFAVDLVERGAVGLAVRAGLDAARGRRTSSALAYAYRTTDLSFVYPLTRGLAPVLTLIASVALLGHGARRDRDRRRAASSPPASCSCSGRGGRGDARALLAVATIAASIAAYTLVDRAGIQHAGALTYFVLVLAGPCLVYPPLVGRGPIRRELRLATASRPRRERRLVRARPARAARTARPRRCSRCARRRS